MQERFETFTVLINRISRNIRKIKNQEMAEYNLRSAHISCLYYLYSANGATATELCERCEEDKATISRALEYLEGNGFVCCQAKTSKRYKTRLLLTEKGLEAGKRIADKIARVLNEISGGLSEEERLAFYRSLSVISESLEAVAQKGDGRGDAK
jgi:DNA-binding MarR family transcriptional regulator